MAELDWVVGFENWSDIFLWKLVATSVAHAMAFNKPQVTTFFCMYEDTLKMQIMS
jgi:hypothetical protein